MAYLTAIVMFRQGISDSLTASIVSGFRNVGLGFVLLSGMAGADDSRICRRLANSDFPCAAGVELLCTWATCSSAPGAQLAG